MYGSFLSFRKVFGTVQCWGSSATAQPVLQVTSQRICSYFLEEGCAELRRIKNYAEIMFIHIDIDIP